MHDLPSAFVYWLTHYGSFALFGLLALGIIAIPVPEETLMVFSGILMKKGDLEVLPTLFAAYGGSLTGVTISYLIGRSLGRLLLKKYGETLGLTHKIEKLHNWFERFGKWTLFFGYFVPGIRHFTGFTAGMGKLEYYKFALFAYSGGIIWASTFMAIGYFFSDYWTLLFEFAESNVDEVLSIIILGIIIFLWFKINRAHKRL